jgi:hypothetical protein
MAKFGAIFIEISTHRYRNFHRYLHDRTVLRAVISFGQPVNQSASILQSKTYVDGDITTADPSKVLFMSFIQNIENN